MMQGKRGMAQHEPKEPKKKKLPLKERLRLIFNSVSKKELRGVCADTLKDLRKPKEIGIFIVSSIVPGGWIGYAAYRIAKYKYKHKPANDNAPEENGSKPEAARPRKPPAAPKP